MVRTDLILVTELEWLKKTAVPGVLTPDELSESRLQSCSAVFLDDTVTIGYYDRIALICRKLNIPIFRTDAEYEEKASISELAALPSFRFLRRHHNLLKTVRVTEIEPGRIPIQTLVDIITTANSILMPKDVMREVMKSISQIIPCEAWSVLIIDPVQPSELSFEATNGPISMSLKRLRIPLGQGIAGWVAQQGEPLIVNDPRSDHRFFTGIDEKNDFHTRNILCAPLVSRGRVIGVIEMVNRAKQDQFSNEDLDLVQLLVNPAAVAIENAYLFQKAEQLTICDDLTGLFNGRHMSHRLESEIRRATRQKEQVSLLFLDLDYFKQVNDRFGHLQGSQTLVDVAHLLRETCRDTDILGRYGGDEFMVILPATDAPGAVRIAERIRASVADYDSHGVNMTVSIGVATYPEHAQSREELVQLADQAMYHIKENGRNGVSIPLIKES